MIKKGWVKELWQVYAQEFFLSFFFAHAIFGLFLISRGLTLAQLGLTTTFIYAANLVFEYPSGIFADKFGRKLSLQLSMIGAILGVLVYAFSTGLLTIILASVFWGISWSFFSGAREALVYDSLKALKKQKQNKDVLGLMDSLGFFAIMIATVTGHLLYSINPKFPFFASAIAYTLGLLIFSTFKEPKQHFKSAETLDIKKAFKQGIGLIFKKKVLFYVFLMGVFLFFFEHAWYETRQPLLLEAGFPFAYLGIYFMIASLIGVVGGVVLPKIVHRLKTKTSIFVVIILQALALIFVASKSLGLLIPFSYFMFVSHLMWSYVDADIIHKHIPSKIRATALSGRQLLFSLIFLFNPWFMAYLVQEFTRQVFLVFGIIVLVGANIIFFIGRRHYR